MMHHETLYDEGPSDGGDGPILSHPLETYNATPFTPKPYDPSRNIVEQHHFPRFGHTNDFDALVKGAMGQESHSTMNDYIVGVCAGAMLIFAVALVWFMVIVALKIAGKP